MVMNKPPEDADEISNASSFQDEYVMDEESEIGYIPDRSVFHLIAMNSFAIAYGLIISTFGLIVLPLESERMLPPGDDNEALLLASFLVICGISQLNGPITGYFSDRATHLKYGKRRPFLTSGGTVAIICLFLLRYASDTKNLLLYYFVFFFAMMALNVMYTAYSGAVTDLVNEKQRGLANGLMGAFMVLGGSAGFGCFSTFLDLKTSYLLFAILLGLSVLISMYAYTEETPTKRRRRQKQRELQLTIAAKGEEGSEGDNVDYVSKRKLIKTIDDYDVPEPWTWKEISELYWIDRRNNNDFFLVFVSRTLYYMGVSVQMFMLYYFRDIILKEDESRGEEKEAKESVALLALLGQLSGGIVCVPMGLLSDFIGGRKMLIYLSTFLIVVAYVGFAFLTAGHALTAYLFGIIYGFGNGTYLSVDYALACDTLPSKREAARYLGIWGVGCFIGTLCGPLLLGPALVIFGDNTDMQGGLNLDANNYSIEGYIAILLMGSAFMIIGAILISFIKSAN